ncbi:helix-turn-helix transcriptional regulator [Sphingomonas oleivorans]|uniref:Helix-turn-helix transcriptional regulator n=1 Tax=Sphingomonas oleivorans TaxID=1735121 RepID=A0A2T5G069_9SPHN|nr:helix-turn-helix transcriptional regulator [Sphingomonas oleivorans]PTQ12335.1 helix-turn-helix transcriptional regulator [Sphingomonas oleivorans]
MLDHDMPIKPTLTERERQILTMMARGNSAKEVALALSVSPRTVESHVDHIRLKIQARNRVHMITIALKFGLLLPGRI